MTNTKKFNITFILTMFAIALVATLPSLIPKIYIDSDLTFHIRRIQEICNNMKEGVFLPAVQGHNMFGFGYLVEIFYPSAFLYIGAFLNFIFNPMQSFQILIFIINIATFLISYYCTKEKEQKFAFLFAIVYTIFPYKILNIYFNGFIGEFFSYMFLPLVIFGTEKLFKENKWKMLAAGMTGILYSHLITLLLCSGYIFIYYVINIKEINKTRIINLIKATIATVLMGLGFLIPFIDMYTSDIYKLKLNAELSKIIMIGNFNIPIIIKVLIQIVFIIGIYFIYKKYKEKINDLKYILIIIYALNMITCLFPWELFCYVPFMQNIQFSTRIIPLLLPITVYLLVKLMMSIKDMDKTIIAFCLSFIPLILTLTMQVNYDEQKIYSKNEFEYFKENTFMDIVAGEYVPASFSLENKEIMNITAEDLLNNNYPRFTENTNYTIIEETGLSTKINIETNNKTNVLLPKTYYKNYKAYLNNKEIPIQEKDGQIYIENIFSGELILKYEISTLQEISALFSIGFTGLFFILLKKDKLTNKKRAH